MILIFTISFESQEMVLISFKLYPTEIQEGTCSTVSNFSNGSYFVIFQNCDLGTL